MFLAKVSFSQWFFLDAINFVFTMLEDHSTPDIPRLCKITTGLRLKDKKKELQKFQKLVFKTASDLLCFSPKVDFTEPMIYKSPVLKKMGILTSQIWSQLW